MSYTARVTGLPSSAADEDVKEFFSRVGDVVGVERTADGSVRISFTNQDDLAEAFRIDGMEYAENVKIQVTSDVPAPAPASAVAAANNDSKEDRDQFKVALRQLPPSASEAELRAIFEPCGKIVDFYLDNRRHYAFIGFTTLEEVDAAITKNGESFNGTPITVERKRRMSRDHCVIVSNVPSDCTADALRIFFASCGEVVDIHLDAARGTAFVNMGSEQQVDSALAMNGKELNGSVLTVTVRERKKCFTCNKEGHFASHCRAKPAIVCRSCGKTGHMARDCRSKPQPAFRGGALRREGGDRRDGDRRDRRRQRSDSRDRRDRRRRSDSRDRRDRRRRHSRSRSRSRSPPRRDRRRHSRSPPRDRR